MLDDDNLRCGIRIMISANVEECAVFCFFMYDYADQGIALHPSKIEVGWVGVRCHPTRLFNQSGVGCPPDTRPCFGRVSGTGRVDTYYPAKYP
jgi:hypothetical protein